jgi:hypothetical protein
MATPRRRRSAPAAVQDPLFEVRLRPERRYFRQILQALTGAMLSADPLRAEIAVSRVLGVVWASDPHRDGAAEEAFGLGLVDYARQSHQPTAVALLRVLGAMGTLREVRDAAVEALRWQAAPMPDWAPAVGAVTVGRCWLTEDAFGDLATILCEFGYGPNLRHSPRHAVSIQVDQANFGAAVDATLVDDVDAAVHDLRFGAGHAHDDFRLVEPGWAGAALGRAFARTDLIPSIEVAPGFAGARALALSRVRALPAAPDALPPSSEPTPERRDAVVAEFRQSPEAAVLAPLVVNLVAALIVDFAAGRDPGELLRVSPARWEAFLASVGSVDGSAPPVDGPAPPVDGEFADVVRAWSAWASRQSGMPLLARDELATVLDELLHEYQR